MTHQVTATSTWTRPLAALFAVLVATGSLSQFFRSSNAVIAPELIRDLGLSPQMLGMANAAFFLALLTLQIPLGVMFDRIGVRRSVAMLSVPMTAGAALHALADSGAMLVAMYPSEQDKQVRTAILGGIFQQGNAKALIEVSKKETDAGLKREAVRWLTMLKSPEATEYLMELLNK